MRSSRVLRGDFGTEFSPNLASFANECISGEPSRIVVYISKETCMRKQVPDARFPRVPSNHQHPECSKLLEPVAIPRQLLLFRCDFFDGRLDIGRSFWVRLLSMQIPTSRLSVGCAPVFVLPPLCFFRGLLDKGPHIDTFSTNVRSVNGRSLFHFLEIGCGLFPGIVIATERELGIVLRSCQFHRTCTIGEAPESRIEQVSRYKPELLTI